MDETYLKKVLSGTAIFNQVNSFLLQWDLREIDGRGLYYNFSGRGSYAHIELKMYQSPKENFRNWVVWAIPKERLLVQTEFRKSVEKVLTFFVEHVSAVKGEDIKLRFEITDGTYHPFDSNVRAFEIATKIALINAFDENLNRISSHGEKLIGQIKTMALEKYGIDNEKK